MKVLVVAAHPDDEVLGCGATMARLAAEGHEVQTAILGEGITSRFDQRGDADPGLLDALRRHVARANEILGVGRTPSLHGLPDNLFDTLPLLDVVKLVEELIAAAQPEVVYTHRAGDLNVDHEVVHRAVLTATRPIGDTVREIYGFEVLSSTQWTFGQLGGSFEPNVFVDVAATLDAKCRAMLAYESEVRDFPHPRSERAIRALAAYRGSTAGFEAAEAFELVRSLRPGGAGR